MFGMIDYDVSGVLESLELVQVGDWGMPVFVERWFLKSWSDM